VGGVAVRAAQRLGWPRGSPASAWHPLATATEQSTSVWVAAGFKQVKPSERVAGTTSSEEQYEAMAMADEGAQGVQVAPGAQDMPLANAQAVEAQQAPPEPEDLPANVASGRVDTEQ
jgi:hypothetical protein